MSDPKNAPATLNDFAGQAEFFRNAATVNKDGSKLTIPRSASIAHFEEGGITRETLEAVKARESVMVSALATLAAQSLSERIKKAREAGEDATTLQQRVSISTIGGSTSVVLHAKKDRPNRFAKDANGNPIEGARSIKFGDLDADIELTAAIAPGLPPAIAASIEAALEG